MPRLSAVGISGLQAGEDVNCVSVANEVAEWEFLSTNSCGWHERIYTDLEGVIITTPE